MEYFKNSIFGETMLFRFLSFAVLFFFVFTTLGAVDVISDNSKELVFEYSLNKYEISTDTVNGQQITSIDFAGSDEFATDARGYRIPYKSFISGIPLDGNVELYLEPLETKVIKLNSNLLKSEDSTHVMDHRGLWLTSERYMTLRDMRAVKFYITPFVYNEKNKTLNILLKSRIRLVFPSVSRKGTGAKIKEGGDYEQMLKSIMLNYNTAQNFRKGMVRGRRSLSPLSTSANMVSFKISDGIKGFNETTDNENGIMKVAASDLLSVFGSSVYINSIAVYAANREELAFSVPDPSTIPTGVEEVPVMRVDVNGNSLFDGSDYLLFYVSSLSDWITKKDTVEITLDDSTTVDSIVYKIDFNLNRLSQDRTYWILNSGGTKSIDLYSSANISDTIIRDTTYNCWKRIRYREVTKYLSTNGARAETEGGIDWVWDKLNESNRHFSFNADLNFSDINKSANGFISIGDGYKGSDTLVLRMAGDTIELNSNYDGVISNWPDSADVNRSVLDLSMTSNTLNDRAFFEVSYIDFTYNSPISLKTSSKVRFFADTVRGITSYGANCMSIGKNFIFRMKDNGAYVDLVDTIINTSVDDSYYYWKDSTGTGVQYFICNESSFLSLPDDYEVLSPTNSNLYEKSNLRGVAVTCDYLIITTDDFISQAKNLAAHKVKENIFANPVIVNVKDIYREFSGGTPDYGAIRNFLSYIHSGGWNIAPDYVLLLGSGHYDYKNYSGKGGNIQIPTCQYGEWCMEDYYTYLDYGDNIGFDLNYPDVFLGRIVALTSNDATNAVSKIIEMESAGSDFSNWRNRFLSVADDDMTPHGVDGITHYLSSEQVAGYSQIQRPALSLRKVYLFEYPWNDIGKKPGAHNALKNEIENGVGCVNYFGHGSWEAWADEDILNKDNVKSISNSGRYPVFTAFSCRVGRFDIPDETSLAGDMVNMENSGAIAFIASTRTAYAGANTSMAKGFYWALYNKENNLSIGQAYSASKIKVSVNTVLTSSTESIGQNIKYYALIGDPSYRINRVTDSVNVNIVSEKVDTIQALETITVTGNIGQFDSTVEITNSSFGLGEEDEAYAQISFYFPDRDDVKRKDGGDDNSITYSLPGDYIRPDTIVAVVNGKFSAKIMMPKRVPFNLEKPILRVYAWNTSGTKVAQVIKDDFVFSGSKSGSVADSSGPSITIRPIRQDSTGKTNTQWTVPVGVGDTIIAALPMVLGVDLWDESGLLLTGTTPGEGLTLEIEGVTEQTSIGNEFIVDPESNGTSGSVEYYIDSVGVSVGSYNLIVGAMDINGNISRKEIVLRVTDNEDLDLSKVYNFPNPAIYGKSTRFYFDHNRMIEEVGQNIDATIRVYTLTGKLIKIFKNASNGELWDLTDQKGHRLSPNVYLYTVSVTMNLDSGYTEKKKKIKSDIKKLVIHPPK